MSRKKEIKFYQITGIKLNIRLRPTSEKYLIEFSVNRACTFVIKNHGVSTKYLIYATYNLRPNFSI